MPLDPEPVRKQFVREFLDAMYHDSDLIAVLRGHLYTEAMLTKLVATKYPGSEPVLQELSYDSKVRLAWRQRIITSQQNKALKTLGEIRNSFAHMPIKSALTEEDAVEFIKTTDSNLRGHVEAVQDKIESTPGNRARSAIVAIFNSLGYSVLKAAVEADSATPPPPD
jgi:hypothetical protein